MQIIVTPSDVIQRCLWDKYKKFCLHDKTEDDIKKLIDDNKPFHLNEEDSYAIGLLKIIETDNLVHRFNENILDSLQIKSNVIKDELYINKTTITKEITTYLDKFPEYYKAPFNYKQAIHELKIYIQLVESKISSLEIVNVKQKEKVFIYYKSKDVRKCLTI
jgi:hypothetical protein